MALSPVTIEQFPGLDLRADPGDSRGALVASHVDLTAGIVRSRAGFVRIFSGTSGETVRFLHNRSDYTLTGNGQYILGITTGASGKFYAQDSTGTIASVVHANLVTSKHATAVTIGTPTATYTYVTDTSAGGPIRRWDGATWTAPAGVPAAAGVLARTPIDNRLVVCDANSKVSFSDQGAPETFGANNFVQLTPGDGQSITAADIFDNKLFVFKPDKFFVFYGNSADVSGNPVFNYRTVDTGIGCFVGNNYPMKALAVGPDALYFQSFDGIYKTTGGVPVKVSQPLDAFFAFQDTTRVNPFWSYGYWSFTEDMTVFDGKLYTICVYFIPGSGTAHRMILVYDIATQVWSAWPDYTPTTLQAAGLMVWNKGLYIGIDKDVLLQTAGTVTDTISGVPTAFISTYRLPFENFGSPTRKRIRETIVDGYGTVLVAWARDWGALDSGATPIVLGAAPTIGVNRSRRSLRGRYFSVQLSTSSSAWQVNRIRPNVADPSTGVVPTS